MPTPNTRRFDTITDVDHNRLRAALAAAGASPGQVQAALGTRPSGRTRDVVAQLLVAWLQRAPKGP